MDLVLRLAAALHIVTTATQNMIYGHAELPIPTVFPLSTLQSAISYVEYLETQKHTLCQVRVYVS